MNNLLERNRIVVITVVFKTTHGCSIQSYAEMLAFLIFKEVYAEILAFVIFKEVLWEFLLLCILLLELFDIAPDNRMSTFITRNIVYYFLPSHLHPEIALSLAKMVKSYLYVVFAYISIFILNCDYKFLITLYMNLYMLNFQNKLFKYYVDLVPVMQRLSTILHTHKLKITISSPFLSNFFVKIFLLFGNQYVFSYTNSKKNI